LGRGTVAVRKTILVLGREGGERKTNEFRTLKGKTICRLEGMTGKRYGESQTYGKEKQVVQKAFLYLILASF
jgi:hypothetical protein